MATNVPLLRPDAPAAATREQQFAYVLFRAFTGLDFFGHGFARIFTGSHLQGFAQGMQKSMAAAPLSPALVLLMGYLIPCVEVVLGALLLLGLWTRATLTAAFGLMFVLMFGVTMKQDWGAAGLQLQYGLVLFVLLFLRQRYDLSWAAALRLGRGQGKL